MSWQSATDAAAQKACVEEALWSAAKSSAVTAALAGAALAGANRVSPTFRNALGASGRAAMIVLPTMAVCFLEVELKINACAQRSRFGGVKTGAEDADILPKRGA